MKKKISAILITALLLTASAVPVFAGTYTEDGTASALVTAEVISSYSIVLVMPSNHLILCHPLLLQPSSGSFPMSQFFPSGSQNI